MLGSILSVQVDMINKILTLKSKYVARRRYVHVRARRRATSHIGLVGMHGLVNLSSKQFDQRLPPLTTPCPPSPDSARNIKF